MEEAVGRELVAKPLEHLQKRQVAVKEARGYAEGDPYVVGPGAAFEAVHHLREPLSAKRKAVEDLGRTLDRMHEPLGLEDMGYKVYGQRLSQSPPRTSSATRSCWSRLKPGDVGSESISPESPPVTGTRLL